MLCVWHDLFDGLCFLPVLYQVSYDGLATHNKGARGWHSSYTLI